MSDQRHPLTKSAARPAPIATAGLHSPTDTLWPQAGTVKDCHEETHALQRDKGLLELVLTRRPTDSRSDAPMRSTRTSHGTQMASLGPRTSSYGSDGSRLHKGRLPLPAL